MRRGSFTLLAVLLAAGASHVSAQSPVPPAPSAPVESAESALKSLVARDAAERDQLLASYKASLERSMSEARARGDLSGVVAWKAEIDRCEQWPVPQAPETYSDHSGVRAHQQKLASMVEAKDAALLAGRRAILTRQAASLDEQIKVLVQANRIPEALALKPAADAAKADLAALPSPAAPAAAETPATPPAVSPAAPAVPAVAMPRIAAEISWTPRPGADGLPAGARAFGSVSPTTTDAGPALACLDRGASLVHPALETLRVDGRSVSLAFWVMPLTVRRACFLTVGDLDDSSVLRVGGDGKDSLLFQFGPDVLEVENALVEARWNHVVCVKDEPNRVLAVFVNGKPLGTTESRTVPRNLHHRKITFGRMSEEDRRGFLGQLGALRFYDGALTPAQAEALHAAERRRVDEAHLVSAAPATTPAQLTASLAGRLLAVAAHERPRLREDAALVVLRPDGVTSSPWALPWKALDGDTVSLARGAQQAELDFSRDENGRRVFTGRAQGFPDEAGAARSGYVLE